MARESALLVEDQKCKLMWQLSSDMDEVDSILEGAGETRIESFTLKIRKTCLLSQQSHSLQKRRVSYMYIWVIVP